MRRGFTLVELIIVIVIIGILALIALPRIYTNIENARRAEAYASARSIADAERAYAASRTGNEIKSIAATGDWPITADFDGDGSNEYDMTDPKSANFDYHVTGVSFVAGYVEAASKRGTISYCRCLASGNSTQAAGNTCAMGSCP